MKPSMRRIRMATACVVLCGLTMPAFAGEHPGEDVRGAEAERVQQAAKEYIDAQVKDKGAFVIYDAKEKRDRKLDFDYFHKVTKLDDGTYFFCSDFTEGKDRLDLDFTMSKALDVKTVAIHKVNGKKRE